MVLPYYIAGLFLGTLIGKGIERSNTPYYEHKEKIMMLEDKIKEYERLVGKKP